MTHDQGDGRRGDQAIALHRYDAAWPANFASEASLLTQVLTPWITGGVHHVGSTAVPGLAAKPVIDIMIGVRDLDSTRPCLDLLVPLDYCYAPYRADVMHWFCKPSPQRRTHHLHLVPTGSQRFTEVLAFRDYLRAHPDAVQEYEHLKQQLAGRHSHDRNAYTDGKSAMVAAITERARRWSAGPNEPWPILDASHRRGAGTPAAMPLDHVRASAADRARGVGTSSARQARLGSVTSSRSAPAS